MQYPRWTAVYANEAFDRAQHLATELTDQDRARGDVTAPAAGYSAANFKRAEEIVRRANAYA